MFPILSDEQILDHDWASVVIVEASKTWPDQLVWENADQQGFTETYRDYVSRFGQLNELFALPGLVSQLEADGYVVAFSQDTTAVLQNHQRWSAPLHIDGLDLRTSNGTPSALYDYQRFSLNRALERMAARHRHDRFFFFGWGLGTGKSAASAAGALQALNTGAVDLVLAFTMRKLKLNLRDFFTDATPLNVAVCDGSKDRRKRLWADRAVQVYVNNYDKAYWDLTAILERIAGLRVLFVFDEVSDLLTDDKKTRVRKAMDELMARCASTAWPMSGSIVDSSPFTYHDNYNLGSLSSATHPLGTKKSFEQRYCDGKTSRAVETPRGWYTITSYDWNHVNLQEVRHRVSHATQNARKTDPGVRENFPGLATEVVRIQLSEPDRKLYEILRGLARAAHKRGESIGEHVELMRYLCNHPGALGLTRHPLGAELAAQYPELVTGAQCSKLEVFCDQVEAIAAAGEQCVGFTKWTELSLHLVSAELAKRRIRFVDHHGAMSDQHAYEQQRRFKSDPTVTLFWSSDAGSHGLSFQNARYVLNYECPYSWSKLNQRMSRIDRADGTLDGRTNYVYVTDDTVEVGIKETNDYRRELAAATMGTREVDTYGENPGPADWVALALGDVGESG